MIWPKCTVRGTKSASVFLNIMADIMDLALKFNYFTKETKHIMEAHKSA